MKKTLLFGMALLGSTIVYAQAPTGGTVITPEGYQISNISEAPIFPTFEPTANFKTSSRTAKGVWEVLGAPAQDYWNAHNGMIGCAWVADEEMMNGILEGTQIVDLGGEVGKVMLWQGMYTNLKEQLEENYPDVDWSNIPAPCSTNMKQGWNLNFWLNPQQIWTKSMGFYRVRIVMNALHYVPEEMIDESAGLTPMNGDVVFKQIYQVNNQGNNTSFVYDGTVDADGQKVNTAIRDGWDDGSTLPSVTNNLFVKRTPSGGVAENEWGDPIWDPSKWIVIDYYLNVAGDAEGLDENGDTTTPTRIKLNTSDKMNFVAFMIKEFSITQFDGELTQEIYDLNKNSYAEVTLAPGVAGVESLVDESNAPVEYYNLQGVKVANPEKGIFIKKQGKTTSKVVLR